jgi:hypothetical protein
MMAPWGSLQTGTTKIMASSIVIEESQHVDCEEDQEDVSGFEGEAAVGSEPEESPDTRSKSTLGCKF